MRQRKAVPAPDFAGAEAGAKADRHVPNLPQPCPVVPLGKDGNKIFFMDRSHQMVDGSTRCEKGDLKLWFGNEWLVESFPQYPKGWKPGDPVTKFDQDAVQTALVEDCRLRGIFNPEGKVFGRGAHRYPGDRDVLALHMGNAVVLANAPDAKGKHTGKLSRQPSGRLVDAKGREAFFPALDALPPPAPEMASAGEVQELYHLLHRWYWVEDKASPLLLLGMIGQMFLCGALDWRSHVWLAGPTASGKTLLQDLIRAIHERWCLHTEDASEAALRQVLRDDTLPVLIDEAEAHDRPERLAAILNLMKKSSAGAKMYRGSTDHKAQGFTAQSCFLLSSVLHASMRGEDRNRIAILQMRAVPDDAPPLDLNMEEWREAGRRMHRRMIELWPRFDRTLKAYKTEIGRCRFEGRWRDTYGTLLACADLMLFDEPCDEVRGTSDGPERVTRLVRMVLPTIERGRVESRSDVERAMAHLMSHQLPGANGKPPESVGVWIDRAMTLKIITGQFATDQDEAVPDEEARQRLKGYGLRMVNITGQKPNGAPRLEDARPERREEAWLAIAYPTNKALADIWRGSEWAGDGYLQSLGKVPNAQRSRDKVRFASQANPDYALLVPLSAFDGPIEELE